MTESSTPSLPWGRLLISLPIAALALWLVLRGVAPVELATELGGVHAGWLALSLALMVGLVLARALRFALLVQAIAPVPLGQSLRIATIGFGAIDTLPVRLGELVRPLLLQSRSGVSFGAGAAVVVVERLFDLLGMVGYFVAALLVAQLPTVTIDFFGQPVDLAAQGRNAVLATVTVFGLPMLAVLLAGERGLAWLEGVLRYLPARLAGVVRGLASGFVQAGRAIGRPSVLGVAAALTAVGWGFNLAVLWTLLWAFHFGGLGFAAASILMTVAALSLLLPSPSGGIGVYEAAVVAGLLLYGVQGSGATAFAFTLHAVHVGVVVVMGAGAMVWEGVALRDLWPRWESR